VWDQWYDVDYGVALASRPAGSATWTLPKSADDVFSPKIFYSNAPRIALNAAGQALIVWYQSTGGPLMVYASERSGPGAPFSRPGPANFLSAPGAPVDSHPNANPAPALAETGEAAVAWTQENGAKAIPVFLATRDRAGKWTRPRDLGDTFSMPVGTARCAQIAFGPRGDLYVVWYQDEGAGDAVLAARRAPDGAWIEDGLHPARLSSEASIAFAPTLAVGPDGEVVVAFAELDHGQTRIVARRTGEAREPWGPREVLSPEGSDGVDPSASVGGPGDRAVVGWAQGGIISARAMFARVE
jgi:hypothetical protein